MNLETLTELPGFVATCLVDAETGFVLASESGNSGFDLEQAAAANVDVVRAKRAALKVLGFGDESVEDIMITIGSQNHLIRPLESEHDVFVYLAVDKKTANMGMARLKLKAMEGTLKF